uniref:Uncharacterized protein n=1 Tax=Globodera rostochiensis TaxID=31243 RepID=A0A914I209_GLORO
MKHLFPKDWLPILLLIAYSASTYITVIEDGTPEAEDLAKALALSKRFFWRTMMEEWDCHKVTINPNEIGVKHAVELRQICERASSSSSSANIPNDQIKVEKPLFRVGKRERELQLSSAMEAIKAAYRVLFGWRPAEGFNTKISPKGKKLNQLKLEEEMENGQTLNYLKEYNKKASNLVNEANLTAYWDSVQELGLDMEMTCKKVIEMQTKHGANLARMIVDDCVWELKDIMQFSEYLYQFAVPNPKKMHLERFVGEMFFNYTGFIHYTMLKKYPDQFKHLKPLQNPCHEATLKVKIIAEGSSSSG